MLDFSSKVVLSFEKSRVSKNDCNDGVRLKARGLLGFCLNCPGWIR